MLAIITAFAIQAAWTTDRTANGWTPQGLSPDAEVLLFSRPGPRPATTWIRMEMREPDLLNTLSSVALYEADCAGRRTRAVQITDFRGANASGQSTDRGEGQWRYPLPSSVGELILILACNGA